MTSKETSDWSILRKLPTHLSQTLNLSKHKRGKSVTNIFNTKNFFDRKYTKTDLIQQHEINSQKRKNNINNKFTLNIEFKNLKYTINKNKNNEKVILNNVSGFFKTGKLIALMGASGSGKTTLINSLLGKNKYYGVLDGNIIINNNINDNYLYNYKDIIGYVPQNNIVNEYLTVKDMLAFNARFRLSERHNNSEANMNEFVDRIIKLLELKKVEHSIIGDESMRGISGGEVRRVNIGMELVSNPSLIFLDEPTSGLDTTTSYFIIKLLKFLSDYHNTTIIVILHQPRYEIFSKFDELMLLNKHGKIIYNDSTDNCIEYFTKLGFKLHILTNPADYIIDIASGILKSTNKALVNNDLSKIWEDYYKNNFDKLLHHNTSLSKNNKNKYVRRKISIVSQSILCFKRELLLFTRHLNALLLHIVEMLIIAIVSGFIVDNGTLESIKGSLYIVSLSFTLLVGMNSLSRYSNHKLLYYREVSVGLRHISYFVGLELSSALDIAIFPIIYLIGFYFLGYTNGIKGNIYNYYIVFVVTTFCVQSISHCISILFNNNKLTLNALVIFLVLNLLNGNIPNLDSFRSNIITNIFISLNPLRWAFEALFIQESLQQLKEPTDYNSVKKSLKEENNNFEGWIITNNQKWICVIIVLTYGIIFKSLTFLALKYNNKDKQL